MIILNNVDNEYTHDQSDFLYAIADIYRRYSNKYNPLKDSDVINILKEDYSLEGVDRHIIKKYREKLEKYGYVFSRYEKEDKSPSRKGWYFEYIDGGIGDDELIGLCYLIKANKSYYKGDSDILLDLIGDLINSERKKELIPQIKKVRTSYSKDKASLQLSKNLRKLTDAIRQKRPVKLTYNVNNIADYTLPERIHLPCYPQFIFVKNERFYVLLTEYYTNDEGNLNTNEIILRLERIEKIVYADNKYDTHQYYGENNYTQYINGKEIKRKIEDIIDNMNDYDTMHANNYFDRTKATFEVNPEAFNLNHLFNYFKSKYGDSCVIHSKKELKNIYNENESVDNAENEQVKSTIEFNLPEKEILDIAIKHINELKIKEPDNLIPKIKDFVAYLNSNVKNLYQ